MRGFVLALNITARVRAIIDLAAASGTELTPFLWAAPPGDHFDQAHAAHLLALAECDRHDIAPCLILEEDAYWDTTTNLTELVESLDCPWTVMTLGIVPFEMAGVYLESCGKNAVKVPRFSAGCHAYIAFDPAKLLMRLAARGLNRQFQHATPCIEYLSGDGLLMATKVHARQLGKDAREGLDWEFKSNKVVAAQCDTAAEWWSQTRNWISCKFS